MDYEEDYVEPEELYEYEDDIEEELEEEEEEEAEEVEAEEKSEEEAIEIEDKEEEIEEVEKTTEEKEQDAEFENLQNFQVISPDMDSTVTITICLPDERRTSHRLAQAEMTAAIVYRASQIEKNPKVFTDNVVGLTNPIEMARQEMKDRKCPLILRRFISPTFCEDWNINEMIHPMSNA